MGNWLAETAELQRLAHLLSDVQIPNAFERSDESASDLVDTILRQRNKFGITRVGAITGLDRLGIPVAQAVRPLSLSNAVSQGKGRSLIQAAASALMESIETFAAERIDPAGISIATAMKLGPEVIRTYSPLVVEEARPYWFSVPLQWMPGWNPISRKCIPVPVAFVDTVYTVLSPHPKFFPRTTTGLGAGQNFLAAVLHAGLEVVERNAIASARQTIGFFDDCQIDNLSLRGETAALLKSLEAKEFVVGLWRAGTKCSIPTYWCHLIPPNRADEFAPYPAEGFASDFTDDKAIQRAILEAAQSRLSVISGAREDITRAAYPKQVDLEKLNRWRHDVANPLRTHSVPKSAERNSEQKILLAGLLDALVKAGAHAVILVPLLCDDQNQIFVVRLVVPPLKHGW
jgi:ribosomal protein S12 methylthiotransferase accessory factor